MATFRKSKKIGPLRVTASPRGLSGSVGPKGVRITRRADGSITRTVGIPGAGIYDTKKIGGSPRRGRAEPPARAQAISDGRWVEILAAPGGKRATAFQRGYVRSAVSRASGGLSCRRIDLAGVAHCEAALMEIGSPVEPLFRQGRQYPSMGWIILALLSLTALMFSIALPPLGVFFLAVGAVALVYILRTRRKVAAAWPTDYKQSGDS